MQALCDHAARFLLWMSQSTLQAGLLVCLILVVRALAGKRLPSRWHYALWLLVCIRVLAPWAPESQFSLHQVLPDLASAPPAQAVLYHPESPIGQSMPDAVPLGPVPSSTGLEPRDALAMPPSVPASPDYPVHKLLFWSLGALWLLGVLLLAGRIVYDHQRLWRIVRQERMLTEKPVLDLIEDCRERLGVTTMVCVVASNAVQSPALFGFIRPRLLLPAGLIRSFSRRQLRHVFLHELAHLRRHDIAVNWIVAMCQILHWFNPLVWLGFHLMRADRELACDQVALLNLEPAQSRYYGLTIIRLLEHHAHDRKLAALASISQDPSQLKKRIRTIAQFKYYAEKMQIGPILIMALLAIIGLTNAQAIPINTAAADQGIKAPLYPTVSDPAPSAAAESASPSDKASKTEALTSSSDRPEVSIDQDEMPERPVITPAVNSRERASDSQEQTQLHDSSATENDSFAQAQGWSTLGGAYVEKHSQFNSHAPQQQSEIRVQGHSSGGQSNQSSQGFVKLVGGDINRSVLGVLNAKELGASRPPRNMGKMLPTPVPPTWHILVYQVEFHLFQINHTITRQPAGTKLTSVQPNLSYLAGLANNLTTALSLDLRSYPEQAQKSPAFQYSKDFHLQRLRRSIDSILANPGGLSVAKKHSLRIAQISQRLYTALEKGSGSGPQRLHRTLVKEWLALKSVMHGTQAAPGQTRH
jgi:beta-lactamase regulating signal transducer with metallopeptidase domain